MHKARKRFLSALLACAMIISLFPFAAFAADGTSLPEAKDGVITLTQNVTLTSAYTIEKDASVTIDLNGYTITNAAGNHTIINNGSLVIKDSKGNGKIVNNASGHSVIQNEPNAVATIESGTLHKTNNTNSSDYYVITNHGNMIINGGTIISESSNSSAIENGWYTPSQNTGKTYATMTINEAEVSSPNAKGGLYTVKNDDYGIMAINGGKFENTTGGAGTVLNWNQLTITNGEFNATNAAVATMVESSNGTPIHEYEKGVTNISGGIFNGILGTNISYSAGITWNITGGTFSSDVSSLVAVNYECTKDESTGKFTVQKMADKLAVGSTSDASGNVSATLEGTFVGNNTDTDEDTNVANNAVSVDITTANSSSTEKSELTVNADTAKSLAAADELTVKSDVATVTLDQTALAKMNNVEKDVVITVEKNISTNTNVAASYTVTVESNSTNLLPDGQDNGTVTITVPTDDTTVQPWYVVDNIYVEKLNVVSTTDDSITFEIGHLSTIELLKSAPTTGTAVGSVTTSSGVTYYSDATSFITAINGASAGSVVNLMADVAADSATKSGNITAVLNVVKGITINGNGYTLSYTGNGVINHIINVTANDTTINDLVINANSAKYGVHFYCTNSGTLNKVNISNAKYACVNVNGAQNVVIKDSTLNKGNGFECIEYAMGTGVQKIPSMSISNVSFDATPYVLADKTTTNAMKTIMTGNPTNKEILDKILENVAYTNDNGGRLEITVGFADGSEMTGSVESTYQPPYTGKYSYEITVADTDNGTVSVDKYATEGEDVTITVTPDKGYMLDELTVTAGSKDVDVKDNGNGTYTFTMPSSKVKVAATFVEDENYDDSITISMTVGSNDFVINDTIVTIPDAAPYIANSRTYVPFRALGEAIGADVVWDNDARTVTYTLDGNEIVMTIGSTTYTVNGVEKTMDVAPEITGERTYVPIRFIGEALGFKVTPLYAEDGTTASVVFEK